MSLLTLLRKKLSSRVFLLTVTVATMETFDAHALLRKLRGETPPSVEKIQSNHNSLEKREPLSSSSGETLRIKKQSNSILSKSMTLSSSQKKDNNTVRYELENENASLHEKVKYLMDENRKLQMEKSDLEEILKNNKVKYEETLVKLRNKIAKQKSAIEEMQYAQDRRAQSLSSMGLVGMSAPFIPPEKLVSMPQGKGMQGSWTDDRKVNHYNMGIRPGFTEPTFSELMRRSTSEQPEFVSTLRKSNDGLPSQSPASQKYMSSNNGYVHYPSGNYHGGPNDAIPLTSPSYAQPYLHQPPSNTVDYMEDAAPYSPNGGSSFGNGNGSVSGMSSLSSHRTGSRVASQISMPHPYFHPSHFEGEEHFDEGSGLNAHPSHFNGNKSQSDVSEKYNSNVGGGFLSSNAFEDPFDDENDDDDDDIEDNNNNNHHNHHHLRSSNSSNRSMNMNRSNHSHSHSHSQAGNDPNGRDYPGFYNQQQQQQQHQQSSYGSTPEGNANQPIYNESVFVNPMMMKINNNVSNNSIGNLTSLRNPMMVKSSGSTSNTTSNTSSNQDSSNNNNG